MTNFSTKVQKLYFCPFLGPFCPKSREREFSQTWDLRRKLANHKTRHFRPFHAKTNNSIFCKSPKSPFLPPFFHFWWKWEFSQIWGLRRKLANDNTLHFRSFLGKTNDSILCKSPKSPFLPIFGPFFWGENESYPEKLDSVTFEPLWTPNFMQNI